MTFTPNPSRIPSRDGILNAVDTKIEFCECPEWPCDVYVKNLTGEERDEFEGSLLKKDNNGKRVLAYSDLRAKLVARTACDETGKRLFSDSDIALLTKKSAAPLQRIFEKAQKLSGLSAEDVTELTEDLKSDPNANSISV